MSDQCGDVCENEDNLSGHLKLHIGDQNSDVAMETTSPSSESMQHIKEDATADPTKLELPCDKKLSTTPSKTNDWSNHPNTSKAHTTTSSVQPFEPKYEPHNTRSRSRTSSPSQACASPSTVRQSRTPSPASVQSRNRSPAQSRTVSPGPRIQTRGKSPITTGRSPLPGNARTRSPGGGSQARNKSPTGSGQNKSKKDEQMTQSPGRQGKSPVGAQKSRQNDGQSKNQTSTTIPVIKPSLVVLEPLDVNKTQGTSLLKLKNENKVENTSPGTAKDTQFTEIKSKGQESPSASISPAQISNKTDDNLGGGVMMEGIVTGEETKKSSTDLGIDYDSLGVVVPNSEDMARLMKIESPDLIGITPLVPVGTGVDEAKEKAQEDSSTAHNKFMYNWTKTFTPRPIAPKPTSPGVTIVSTSVQDTGVNQKTGSLKSSLEATVASLSVKALNQAQTSDSSRSLLKHKFEETLGVLKTNSVTKNVTSTSPNSVSSTVVDTDSDQNAVSSTSNSASSSHVTATTGGVPIMKRFQMKIRPRKSTPTKLNKADIQDDDEEEGVTFESRFSQWQPVIHFLSNALTISGKWEALAEQLEFTQDSILEIVSIFPNSPISQCQEFLARFIQYREGQQPEMRLIDALKKVKEKQCSDAVRNMLFPDQTVEPDDKMDDQTNEENNASLKRSKRVRSQSWKARMSAEATNECPSSPDESVSSSSSWGWSSERERMRPWLIRQTRSGAVPGLKFLDEAESIIRVPWTHAARQGWTMNSDACLFQLWAIHTNKWVPGQPPDPKRWKANFRCAMNSLPDIVELSNQSIKKGGGAFKVYKLLNPGEEKEEYKAKLKDKELKELASTLNKLKKLNPKEPKEPKPKIKPKPTPPRPFPLLSVGKEASGKLTTNWVKMHLFNKDGHKYLIPVGHEFQHKLKPGLESLIQSQSQFPQQIPVKFENAKTGEAFDPEKTIKQEPVEYRSVDHASCPHGETHRMSADGRAIQVCTKCIESRITAQGDNAPKGIKRPRKSDEKRANSSNKKSKSDHKLLMTKPAPSATPELVDHHVLKNNPRVPISDTYKKLGLNNRPPPRHHHGTRFRVRSETSGGIVNVRGLEYLESIKKEPENLLQALGLTPVNSNKDAGEKSKSPLQPTQQNEKDNLAIQPNQQSEKNNSDIQTEPSHDNHTCMLRSPSPKNTTSSANKITELTPPHTSVNTVSVSQLTSLSSSPATSAAPSSSKSASESSFRQIQPAPPVTLTTIPVNPMQVHLVGPFNPQSQATTTTSISVPHNISTPAPRLMMAPVNNQKAVILKPVQIAPTGGGFSPVQQQYIQLSGQVQVPPNSIIVRQPVQTQVMQQQLGTPGIAQFPQSTSVITSAGTRLPQLTAQLSQGVNVATQMHSDTKVSKQKGTQKLKRLQKNKNYSLMPSAISVQSLISGHTTSSPRVTMAKNCNQATTSIESCINDTIGSVVQNLHLNQTIKKEPVDPDDSPQNIATQIPEDMVLFCRELASKLGLDWRQFASALNVCNSVIDDLETQHGTSQQGIEQSIWSILKGWDEPTADRLQNALESVTKKANAVFEIQISRLPSQPDLFCGREGVLDDLVEELTTGTAGVVVLAGEPGIGKSTAAIMTGHQLQLEFNMPVAFVDLKNLKTLQDLAARILAVFGQSPERITQDDDLYFNPRDQCIRMLRTLTQTTVIILDNAEDVFSKPSFRKQFLNFLDSILKMSENIKLLCTADGPVNVETEVEVRIVPILELEPCFASEMLRYYATSDTKTLNEQDFKFVLDLCESVPLNLAILGALLDNSQKQDEIMQELKKQSTDMPDELKEKIAPKTFICLKTSYMKLTSEMRQVFAELSVFPSSFDVSAAKTLLQRTWEVIATSELKELVHWSLLIRDDNSDTYCMHPVVREFARWCRVEYFSGS